MHQLDRLLTAGLRTPIASRAGQKAVLWKQLMREVMFSPVLRDQTDWTLAADIDVVNAGASGEIDSGAGVVYGILIDSIFDVTSSDLVFFLSDSTDQTLNATSVVTFGGGEFGAVGEELVALKLVDASDGTSCDIFPFVFPDGIVHATNIQLMADGSDGTAPTANDVRCHVIYRDGATSRV